MDVAQGFKENGDRFAPASPATKNEIVSRAGQSLGLWPWLRP